jgi:DNA-binding transcriptional regulator YiaG
MRKPGRNIASSHSLPEQLRNWRERNNFSQSRAANALQVSVRTLQNWEQGHRAPQGFALQHLRETIRQSL